MKYACKIKKLISSEIQVGDTVKIIDGSGLCMANSNKQTQPLYIVYPYESIFYSTLKIEEMEFKVLEINIDNYVSSSEHIVIDWVYLLDVIIEYNGVKLRTFSKSLIKV